MSFNYNNRKVHYWLSGIFLIPTLCIILTGVTLQVKKQVPWVQPKEVKAKFESSNLAVNDFVQIASQIPECRVSGWEDIERVDIRASKGIAKVIAKSGYEAQIELTTGKVLQVAYRRSDIIESIHDGSFFAGDVSKLGVFLTTGVVLLILSLSGFWMFVSPILVRRRKRKKAVRD
jgi:hypothetical protein